MKYVYLAVCCFLIVLATVTILYIIDTMDVWAALFLLVDLGTAYLCYDRYVEGDMG